MSFHKVWQQLDFRNQAFQADFQFGALPKMPAWPLVVLSCVDARVDPAHFLALQPGEALVFRTPGGRVTDGFVSDIRLLIGMVSASMVANAPTTSSSPAKAESANSAPGFSPTVAAQIGSSPSRTSPSLVAPALAIVHHTDCGLGALANPPIRQVLTQTIGMAEADLADLAVTDSHENLLADRAKLKTASGIPPGMLVAGYRYDVRSGTLTLLMPPAHLSEV